MKTTAQLLQDFEILSSPTYLGLSRFHTERLAEVRRELDALGVKYTPIKYTPLPSTRAERFALMFNPKIK